MHKAINLSFDKVYVEIKGCDRRVTEIEETLAIKKAVCKERKEKAKTKRDYWIPIIRIVNVAGILALLTLVWGKLVAIWEMVP
jgi:hypothetical protein